MEVGLTVDNLVIIGGLTVVGVILIVLKHGMRLHDFWLTKVPGSYCYEIICFINYARFSFDYCFKLWFVECSIQGA